MNSDSIVQKLVFDLLDSVKKMEDLVKEHVPKKDFEAFKDEISLKIAKIEGMLSAKGDINLNTTTNFGDVDGDVNIKKDEKHGK